SEEDENAPLYQQAVARLDAVGNVTNAELFLIDRQYATRGDSTRGVALGQPNHRAELDHTELDRLFDDGKPVRSVTFLGNDGRYYQTGYAAVRAPDKSIVLALGAM